MRIVLSALTFTLLASAQRSVPVDNEQVKVLSVVDPASRPPGRMHDHKMNRVMIYLDGGTQRLAYQDGKVEDLKFRAGQALWSPASGMHTSQNLDAKPHRLVEIELKGAAKAIQGARHLIRSKFIPAVIKSSWTTLKFVSFAYA